LFKAQAMAESNLPDDREKLGRRSRDHAAHATAGLKAPLFQCSATAWRYEETLSYLGRILSNLSDIDAHGKVTRHQYSRDRLSHSGLPGSRFALLISNQCGLKTARRRTRGH
jgi:hypothetical protein